MAFNIDKLMHSEAGVTKVNIKVPLAEEDLDLKKFPRKPSSPDKKLGKPQDKILKLSSSAEVLPSIIK